MPASLNARALIVGSLLLPVLALSLARDASPGQRARSAVLFVSPSGSDGGPCSRAKPCASFDRAYSLARPGTIVEVRAGQYRPQTIEAHGKRVGPKVLLRPAPGAKVRVRGELTIRASYLEVRRMTVTEVEIPREAHHVVLRHVRNRGIWMQGPSDISVIGGEVSCGLCPYHPHIDDGGPPDFRPPRRIVFDGVGFHDWHAASSDQHTECLQILAGDGITIRNSVFRNCGTANNGRGATASLHVSWLGRGPKTRNIRIENNFFFRSGNTYAIQAGDYAGLRIRYNSIVGPILVHGGYGDGTPVELVGNVMGFDGCRGPRGGSGPVAPLRYRHNVLDGGRCGPSDVDAPSGFRDPRRNLHLRSDAAAIDRGAPDDHPSRDIDGQSRPMGGRADAGADEAR